MASGPITSWQIDGETVETVAEFIFLGSKITADGDCSHEIKRCLLLGRKVMTNLDSILKSRDITLPTKVDLVKAMVFPVVMYGCESWTIKKAEHRRIDAFKLWCWRRLLRVPWNARRSSQSILRKSSVNIHWKDWCWSWNSNTLATSCEELTHWKRPWCWERLKVGGEGDDRGWDGWMASLTWWTWVWVNSGSWWWTGRPGGHRVGHDWVTELTELNSYQLKVLPHFIWRNLFFHFIWLYYLILLLLSCLHQWKRGEDGDRRWGSAYWLSTLVESISALGQGGGCLETIIHSKAIFFKGSFYMVLTPAFHFLNVACL